MMILPRNRMRQRRHKRWHGITMNWKCTSPLKCIYLHRMTFILTICFNYSMQIYILLALFPFELLYCVAYSHWQMADIYWCCERLCTIYVWFRSNGFYWNGFCFFSFVRLVVGWFLFSHVHAIAFQTWIHLKAICWRASCSVIIQCLKDLSQKGYGKEAATAAEEKEEAENEEEKN